MNVPGFCLKRTSGIDEKCKEAIIAAVKRIADRDLALWERWVQRKEHNTNWQQLLFSVLSKVSRESAEAFCTDNQSGYDAAES